MYDTSVVKLAYADKLTCTVLVLTSTVVPASEVTLRRYGARGLLPGTGKWRGGLGNPHRGIAADSEVHARGDVVDHNIDIIDRYRYYASLWFNAIASLTSRGVRGSDHLLAPTRQDPDDHSQ